MKILREKKEKQLMIERLCHAIRLVSNDEIEPERVILKWK